MNKRHAIGKRIVGVVQVRKRSNFNTTVFDVNCLILEDGTKLFLNVVDAEVDPIVDVIPWRDGNFLK